MLISRTFFATVAMVAIATSAAGAMQKRDASPVGSGRGLFISPMGEPFRGASRKDSLRTWFDGADANRDGGLSLSEMRGDGERFYGLLNVNKDRELDPNELRTYEQQIVPEIRVGASSAPAPGPSDNPNASKAKLERERRGAGVYGLLATPNPVASADTNFNRGISPEEFARAARDRFTMLDANRDGQIRFDELPGLPSRF